MIRSASVGGSGCGYGFQVEDGNADRDGIVMREAGGRVDGGAAGIRGLGSRAYVEAQCC